MTIFSAPTEAQDYFGNLRQELWELREDLRKASRRNRPRRGSDHKGSGSSLESGSLRVLQDTVKRIQRRFRQLERPFLLDPERDDPDIDSAWAHYNLRTNYCNMNLSHRIRWLRSKSQIVNMAQEVSRIMIRRINAEVNNILLSMQDMERSRQQTLDQIWDMQDRLHDHSDDNGTYPRRRN
ncbi:hypothetical protein MMC15_004678 [Xylographa vitiligo]|nr:hypothetical protein [Xylographa vitiligo]